MLVELLSDGELILRDNVLGGRQAKLKIRKDRVLENVAR